MAKRQMSVGQLATMLRNRLVLQGKTGWLTSTELHDVMRDWDVRSSRRSAAVKKLMMSGTLERSGQLGDYRYRLRL